MKRHSLIQGFNQINDGYLLRIMEVLSKDCTLDGVSDNNEAGA